MAEKEVDAAPPAAPEAPAAGGVESETPEVHVEAPAAANGAPEAADGLTKSTQDQEPTSPPVTTTITEPPQEAPADATHEPAAVASLPSSSAPVATDAAAPAPVSAPVPAPKKRGRPRKVPLPDGAAPAKAKPKAKDDNKDEETESEVERSPAKKVKRPVGRPRGRPRKNPVVVKEPDSDTEDEEEAELIKRVDALPDEIKAMFGKIVWVKMGGYPWWPGLVIDPRRVDSKHRKMIMKDLEIKYLVRFYQTLDFTVALYKNVEPWEDTKHNYREGFPAKDAKAPKRRAKLMLAIEKADKEVSLPVEERMEGLLASDSEDDEEEENAKPPSPPEPVPVKRKPGRPKGSKSKPKTDPPRKPGRPKGSKSKPKITEAEKPPPSEPAPIAVEQVVLTPEEEDESAAVPALSKEEIKAKIANRKTPSKKKAGGEEKTTATKKATKGPAVPKSEGPTKSTSEIDTKRKKEIELVVPRKSVKSADIREATEEAARKKLNGADKVQDKVAYKVGNLAQFARKMTRFHMTENSKNNDELVQMLTQLFGEKVVYRSDVERSGLAAIIAQLRKSSNPTVAQTASAVRKHLMRVLEHDGANEEPGQKKHKSESDEDAKPAKKKQKTSAPTFKVSEAGDTDAKNAPNDATKSDVEAPEATPADDKAPTKIEESAAPPPQNDASDAKIIQVSDVPDMPKTTEANVMSDENVQPTAPELAPTADPKQDVPADKYRRVCIEMLTSALQPCGGNFAKIAHEIEDNVFDRFKESNDEYKACARRITFGLKKNANIRERLSNGSLHALEVVFRADEIFQD